MNLKTKSVNLILNRIFKGPKYTIGKLLVNDAYLCDMLEDPVREIGPNGDGKVYGDTAIPEGAYEIVMTMSPRFKRILPRLLNVPHFEGVLIHAGNTSKDTEGCLLPGLNTIKGMVTQSKKYETEIINILQKAADEGKKITITIT